MRIVLALAVIALMDMLGAGRGAAQVRVIERLSPIPVSDQTISFSPRSAALSDEAKNILDRQAAILLEFPDDKATIFGHADWFEAGSRQGAWDLGLTRAIAARDYLIAKGVSPERLRPDSRGGDFVLQTKDRPSRQALAGMRIVTTEVPVRRRSKAPNCPTFPLCGL